MLPARFIGKLPTRQRVDREKKWAVNVRERVYTYTWSLTDVHVRKNEIRSDSCPIEAPSPSSLSRSIEIDPSNWMDRREAIAPSRQGRVSCGESSMTGRSVNAEADEAASLQFRRNYPIATS